MLSNCGQYTKQVTRRLTVCPAGSHPIQHPGLRTKTMIRKVDNKFSHHRYSGTFELPPSDANSKLQGIRTVRIKYLGIQDTLPKLSTLLKEETRL